MTSICLSNDHSATGQGLPDRPPQMVNKTYSPTSFIRHQGVLETPNKKIYVLKTEILLCCSQNVLFLINLGLVIENLGCDFIWPRLRGRTMKLVVVLTVWIGKAMRLILILTAYILSG